MDGKAQSLRARQFKSHALRGFFVWALGRDSHSRPMRVVAFDPADSGLTASDQAFARREDTLSVLAKASVLTLSGRASARKGDSSLEDPSCTP